LSKLFDCLAKELEVRVDPELHEDWVKSLELLDVRDIFLGVFLSLRSNQSHEIEVIGR
jgi:hypothetical protein